MSDGSAEDDAEEQPTGSGERIVHLPSAKAMTYEEAYSITAASRTRLIVLAGAPRSGKTTLLAALFHAFQRGHFGEYWFCECATLLGFDERCHDARIGSLRERQETERTKAGTQNLLLHLQVRKCETGPVTDLLFLDMSGEDFEDARDSVEECAKLRFLRRADHFVLLVDGEKLADLSRRQKAKTDALTLLRSCFDSQQLNQQSLVDVLISKWDLAVANSVLEAVTSFADLLADQVKERFDSRCKRLRIARIAARPEHGFPLGYGLDGLFPEWITDIPQAFQVLAPVRAPQVFTEFDRFI